MALVLAVALLGGCSRNRRPETVYRMGEPVTVGKLTYTVLETEWQTEMGEGLEQRVPQHRFLLIRLSITNESRESSAAVPLLVLEDQTGRSHREVTEARGVASWLGLLRLIQPGATLRGTIVFDVPPADYRLRVVSGGDLETESTALVGIPFTIAPSALPLPAGKPPGLE
jgi:hypothetical protein